MIETRVTTFFSKAKALAAVEIAERRALSRIGAAIRRRAIGLLGRKTKSIARPGDPPNVHEGSLRRLLYYAYDPSTKTEVIGPEAIGSSNVPNILEFGTTGRQIHPFMGPALSATEQAGEIPAAWQGSVRG